MDSQDAIWEAKTKPNKHRKAPNKETEIPSNKVPTKIQK